MLKTSWSTPLTDVSSVARDVLGMTRTDGRGRWYKYVQLKNTGGTVAGVAGSMVAYGAATGYDNSLVVIKLSDADAIVLAAGALLAAVPGVAGTTYYVWIQTRGPITLDTAVTGAAIGKSWFLSTADKTPTVGANAFDQKAGLSASATTKVILTCPD